MKVKMNFGISIGGPSIILIMIVFALTVFSILSIKASYYELKLTQKAKSSIEEYYRADSLAEEVLREATVVLQSILTNKGDMNDVEEELLKIKDTNHIWYHNNRIGYEVAVGEYAILQIELNFIREKDRLGKIEVLSWKMIAKEQVGYDEPVQLWDGSNNK